MSELNIWEFGGADAMPVLWVHGWMGSGEEGQELQRHLGPEYRVLCPDLPGHGRTPLADWTLGETLMALAELGQKCAAGMGYSMGGRLLMMAAARNPVAFPDVVIESAHPGLESPQQHAERRSLDRERAGTLRVKDVTEFCEEWYAADLWDGIRPPERQGCAEDFAEALNRFSLAEQPDLRPWLRTCRNRLLWLAGSRDPAYVGHAQWVRRCTPHQVELLDTGHNVHLQDPEGWAIRIRTFLPRDTQRRTHD